MIRLAVIAAILALAAPTAAQPRQVPPWYKARPECGGRWGGTPGVVCKAVLDMWVIATGRSRVPLS